MKPRTVNVLECNGIIQEPSLVYINESTSPVSVRVVTFVEASAFDKLWKACKEVRRVKGYKNLISVMNEIEGIK